MKAPRTKKVAKQIGDDSWELINFEELPEDATVQQQIEALQEDRQWQEDHINEVGRAIDRLIQELQDE